MRKDKLSAAGFLSGAVNGLFGAGGGNIAVLMLEREGADPKTAHASALALTLVFSIVSIFIYTAKGALDPVNAAKLLPFGAMGAFVGTRLMKRIDPMMLVRLFACVMIYFGIRMMTN